MNTDQTVMPWDDDYPARRAALLGELGEHTLARLANPDSLGHLSVLGAVGCKAYEAGWPLHDVERLEHELAERVQGDAWNALSHGWKCRKGHADVDTLLAPVLVEHKLPRRQEAALRAVVHHGLNEGWLDLEDFDLTVEVHDSGRVLVQMLRYPYRPFLHESAHVTVGVRGGISQHLADRRRPMPLTRAVYKMKWD